jgi:hypothetical protein
MKTSLNSTWNEKCFGQLSRENRNTYFLFNNFFRKSCCWLDNVEEYGRVWQATDTHSEYVILIAVPRQQWLHERASMLRYTYIASLVKIS